ncbi:MAG: menaquinone biosynthesis protein [Rikenellaceae bacterium]
MSSRVKIASVSYLNSVPFRYGIESSKLIDAESILATPSECAEMFANGEVDIALIPTAAIKRITPQPRIITSHCIGATGAVRTVVLLSDDPIDEIERIWLDTDSQTSIQLCAQLCANRFGIAPQWHRLSDMNRLQHPKDGDAFLLIGDKVFAHEDEFEYSHDLAEEYIAHTGMPFVFAAWCAQPELSEEVEEDLEEALTWGVEHTYEAMVALRPDIEVEAGYHYLTENIDTMLDSSKRAAMEQFWGSEVKINITEEV